MRLNSQKNLSGLNIRRTMKNFKLYKGFLEYIRDNSGLSTKDHTLAMEALKEFKYCEKNKCEPLSYWKVLCSELFKRNGVNDERINEEEILTVVTFEHNNEEYKTDVRYVTEELEKFPAQSRLMQNILHKDDSEFVKDILKRSIDRYEKCDPSKVYMWKNYVLIFTNE